MERKVPTAWGEPDAVADGLAVWLRSPLPPAAGPAFVHGAALHESERVQAVTLGGSNRPAMASAMPSPGLAAERGERAARAIFWGVTDGAGRVEVALDGGGRIELDLGVADVAEVAASAPSAPLVICMATHEPPAEMFERQIESLVAQTETGWVCVISDDASGDAATERIARVTADDSRFVVSRSDKRLGAYANFGRALAQVPADASHVALADQDDVWNPDKLARLGDSLSSRGASLAFSDMRVTRRDGSVIANTYWTSREPNHHNFNSLLLGNSVTGAASMFRRELLDDALPLPPHFGNLYHDHWLALVAAARGTIEYVDQPLYDYVQHGDAVIGHAGANRGVVGGSLPRRLAALRGRPPGRLRDEWRRIYFGEYCRMALTAVALEQRLGSRLDSSHARALKRALALDHSTAAVAWLTARQVRRLRRDDTGGSEAGMLRGLAWRRGIGRRRGHDPIDDGDLPPEMLAGLG
jgi:hypothetical protein